MERNEERAWRWSFAAAGVDAQSEAFRTQAAAVADLRELQLMLFPVWLQADQSAIHLESLLRSRAQRKRLDGLACRPALAFASGRLRESEVAASRALSSELSEAYPTWATLAI